MRISGDNGKRHNASMSPADDLVGEWVERALEAPNGDELGRMLRHSQHEEAAWRRFRAAERRVESIVTGGPA